jgi:uncharacterized protein YdbL (DUF1318 family)
MYKQKLIMIITLVMTTVLISGISAQNGAAASLKDRMLARVPAINSLKDQGLIGENNQGYLEYRASARPEQKMISDENADRKMVYTEIARSQKVDVTLVGQRRASQIRDIGAAGHWFQKPDGAWYKK